MNLLKAVDKLGRLYMDRVGSSRDMRAIHCGWPVSTKKLRAKWARAPRPEWAYHGSSWNEVLGIVRDGLVARGDRVGISVTTDPERAKLWGWFKSTDEEPMLLRTDARRLRRWTPDMFAPPALPEYDFLTGTIPPEKLEVKVGRRWIPLLKWNDDTIKSDPLFKGLDDDEVEDARHAEWAEWVTSRDMSERKAVRVLRDAGVVVDPDLLRAKIDGIWVELIQMAEAHEAKIQAAERSKRRGGKKKPKRRAK